MRQDLAQEQPGALALRVGEKFLRGAALDDLAAVRETVNRLFKRP
jgi:hypothetical protein